MTSCAFGPGPAALGLLFICNVATFIPILWGQQVYLAVNLAVKEVKGDPSGPLGSSSFKVNHKLRDARKEDTEPAPGCILALDAAWSPSAAHVPPTSSVTIPHHSATFEKRGRTCSLSALSVPKHFKTRVWLFCLWQTFLSPVLFPRTAAFD